MFCVPEASHFKDVLVNDRNTAGLGYGVTANIAASHSCSREFSAAARGSIPRIRMLFFFQYQCGFLTRHMRVVLSWAASAGQRRVEENTCKDGMLSHSEIA